MLWMRPTTFKLISLLFSNPTNKTKAKTANRWETTNSKPSGPSIMVGQSETGRSSQILVTRICTSYFLKIYCGEHPLKKRWENFILLSQNFSLSKAPFTLGVRANVQPKSSIAIGAKLKSAPRALQ